VLRACRVGGCSPWRAVSRYKLLSYSIGAKVLPAWEAASDEAALFKVIEGISVPAVVARKLAKLVDDPFFYKTRDQAGGAGDGAGAHGPTRGSSRRRSQRGPGDRPVSGGKRTSRPKSGGSSSSRSLKANSNSRHSAVRKLKDVFDI